LLSDNFEHHIDLEINGIRISRLLNEYSSIGLFNSVFMNNILKGSIGELFLEKLFKESESLLIREVIPDKLYEKTDFIFKDKVNKRVFSIDVKHWIINKTTDGKLRLEKQIAKRNKKQEISRFYGNQGYEVFHVLAPTISENDTKYEKEVDLYIIPINKFTTERIEAKEDGSSSSKIKIHKNEEYSFFEELNKLK
jgi:hypothetical protein